MRNQTMAIVSVFSRESELVAFPSVCWSSYIPKLLKQKITFEARRSQCIRNEREEEERRGRRIIEEQREGIILFCPSKNCFTALSLGNSRTTLGLTLRPLAKSSNKQCMTLRQLSSIENSLFNCWTSKAARNASTVQQKKKNKEK